MPPKRKRPVSVVRPVLLAQASTNFADLPVDILRLIFERLLDVKANDPALLSAFRFAQVCRRFRLGAARAFGLGDVALLHRFVKPHCQDYRTMITHKRLREEALEVMSKSCEKMNSLGKTRSRTWKDTEAARTAYYNANWDSLNHEVWMRQAMDSLYNGVKSIQYSA